MVIINNSDKTQELNLHRFAENLNTFTNGKDIISGKEFNTEINVLFLNGNIAALHFGFLNSKEFFYYKPVYDTDF